MRPTLYANSRPFTLDRPAYSPPNRSTRRDWDADSSKKPGAVPAFRAVPKEGGKELKTYLSANIIITETAHFVKQNNAVFRGIFDFQASFSASNSATVMIA